MNPFHLALKIEEIGALKFGNFTLKSGISSPIYVDLRLIVSYPSLLRDVAELIWSKMQQLSFDLVCGVPYTALPIATALSLFHEKPMVMRRKEIKNHGTKKVIEGVFERGQTCLVIEDLITSGASLLETIDPLEAEGLKVNDTVVLIDREQGGKTHLMKRGYNLHAAFTLTELLTMLENSHRLDKSLGNRVRDFIKANQI